MKKIISIIIIVVLLFTSEAATVSAKTRNQGNNSFHNPSSGWNNNGSGGWDGSWNAYWNYNGGNYAAGDYDWSQSYDWNQNYNWTNQEYDWSGWQGNWGYNWWGGTAWSYDLSQSSTINYGSFRIPTAPFTEGMGAATTYSKKNKVFTVKRGTITIKINLKNKKVYVNGKQDRYSDIFTSKDKDKSKALIAYIAEVLGVKVSFDDEDVTVVTPGLEVPYNLSVTAVGGTVVANSLNSTNLYLTATARIKAGQATGGRAELYVGSKLVATDSSIASSDTTVTFTTSDNTPVNQKLRAAVPAGGVVSVRLYNVYGNIVVSTANPTLAVDYTPPAITGGISQATYLAAAGKLYLTVAGASAVGDKVDVTRLKFYNSAFTKSYTLTAAASTGSSGVVTGGGLLEITVGPVDRNGILALGNTSVLYLIADGALLYDAAGNKSTAFTSAPIQVNLTGAATVPSGLDAPRNITLNPSGGTIAANTLNKTNTALTVTAQITAGQATGGRAELYVDSRLITVDSNIAAGDTYVTFTVPDGSASADRLQAAVPAGGVVTVRLYKSDQSYYVTSAVANPTLKVDYKAPSISGISSAGYSVDAGQLYIIVSGAGQPGDKVDLSKLTLFDSTGKTVYLGNASGTTVTGTVSSEQILLINLGSLYRDTLKNFSSTAYLKVSAGALLSDTAGNTSAGFANDQIVPLTIIKTS